MDQSPPFIIKSPFAGCNIAFDAGNASSSPPRPSLFYIPDGSPMEPASEYAFLSINVRGDVVHRAKAHGGVPPNGSWDWPFVSFDPTTRLAYGVGSLRPPPGPNGNTSLVSFDPVTGLQTVIDGSPDLQFVGEEPFCVSGVDGLASARGRFYFVNGVIEKNLTSQIVTLDVASGRRVGILQYNNGLIMSVAGYTNKGGIHSVIAAIEPQDKKEASSIVLVDPLAKTWDPTHLLTLSSGWTPSQGEMTVIGDFLVVIIQEDGRDRSQIIVGNLSASPPVFNKAVDIDLSCCPFGTGALGGVAPPV